ncbi:hypothetical protein BASA50_008815 [Batrachochytrium salamandrivorans]|uniref:DUF4201 domain-containing protein n=1 Tax=Batrachochytrium salamandrivorans TaxID=1357716 RepID=A0ABQ8F323_9FUNG|nr:hypothetical protein BASA50_008815 [Batrachochytrium salamandrivorans]
MGRTGKTDSHQHSELKHLPLSEELLEYYRRRIESSENEFQSATQRIDQLSISHNDSHKLSWELHKRAQEVVEMQQALSDFQTALFDERKHTLRIVADNDQLKIQELKDRKKIRFLLSLGGAPEEEVTYFRDRLDKRLVKIARVSKGPASGISDKIEKGKIEEQDLIILEDEVQGLKLTVSALQTQLDEQRKAYDDTLSGLMKDRSNKTEEERVRREYDAVKVEEYLSTIKKLRTLCRENTRELLRTKKVSHAHERNLIEEKAAMVKELNSLQARLSHEHDRNEMLKSKLEADVRAAKLLHDQTEAANTRKINYFKSRLETVNASYTSLKRRRDYEIEGFTNDILSLRKQLRTLEKNILKFSPLEDKELVLLNLARLTGERASKISTQLQSLKTKVYATEKEVQELKF